MKAIIDGQVNLYGLIRAFRPGAELCIKPTMRCNLACWYCSAEHSGSACWVNPAPDRPVADWVHQFESEIIRRYDWLIRQVFISGGEPFLYKDIVPLLDWLTRGKGFCVYVVSNLMIPPPAGLRKNRRVKIRASLHEDAYEAFGEDSAKRMFEDNLRDYRKLFLVHHLEFDETFRPLPAIHGSAYRAKIERETTNKRTIDVYGPDGTLYEHDAEPNKGKYDKWRAECEGVTANPLRKLIMKRRAGIEKANG